MIVLIGFMGAGKTTVGALLADRLGRPFIDTDREVQRVAGMTIAELFQTHGEGRFRELERQVVAKALERDDAVVSLGGGALGDPVTRAALEWADVVFLDVSFGEAMRRAGGGEDRPLLRDGDPKALYDERAALYASAAGTTVPTDGRDPGDIADDLAARFAASSHTRIRVNTQPGYDIVIGEGLLDRFPGLVPVPAATTRVAIVTHPDVRTYADRVAASLDVERVEVVEVPSGEASKRLTTAERILDALAEIGLRRGDLVIGVGGGVICDLAGFVASIYYRGIAVAHVPTTLLAQVDAAIGGKTAVDLAAGKNLAGTFHQPVGVLCDAATLDSLPVEEFRSGLAEVVKAGFIADPGLLDIAETKTADIFARRHEVLRTIVLRSAAMKASVVASDERDGGSRAVLNYGHTVGHALEHSLGSLRHGEAVALGMVAAAYIAHDLGFIDEELVERHRAVLRSLGLPTGVSTNIEEIQPALLRDKKTDADLRFVLLKGVGTPVTGVPVPRDAVERALKRLDG